MNRVFFGSASLYFFLSSAILLSGCGGGPGGDSNADQTPSSGDGVIDDNFTLSTDNLSPNGDGDNDILTISGQFDTQYPWELNILTDSGAIVYAWAGLGRLVEEQWDGHNLGGDLVADGNYHYLVNAFNDNGSKIFTDNGSFVVNAHVPEFVALDTSPVSIGPAGLACHQATTVTASFTETVNWNIDVEDADGLLMAASEGSGDTLEWTWDGYHNGDYVDEGTYSITISATDTVTQIQQTAQVQVASQMVEPLPNDDLLRFFPPINLSETEGHTYAPSIAVAPDDTIHIIWHDNSFGGMEVLTAHSTDGGATYSSPINLSNSLGLATFADIKVADDGTVFAAWQDNVSGISDIYLTRSNDGGLTFTTPVNISNTDEPSAFVDLDLDPQGNLFASWGDSSKVILARLLDNAQTFETILEVETVVPQLTEIVVDSNAIHFVWQDIFNGASQVFYQQSINGGLTWSGRIQVSDTLDISSVGPAVTTDDKEAVIISWTEQSEPNLELFMARSTDGGVSFTAPFNITNNEGQSIGSDLAYSGDTLYLVWQDTDPGNYEALIKTSTDFGQTFTDYINIAPSDKGSLVTKIAVDSQQGVHVTWDDNRWGAFDAIVASGYLGLPAVTELQLTPNPVTPNGDGEQDELQISASFSQHICYQMSVSDTDNNVIYTVAGDGSELNYLWDLMLNGEIIDDGFYTVDVTGNTLYGDRVAGISDMFVSNTAGVDVAPELVSFVVAPVGFGPDGDGRQEQLFIDAEFNKPLDWNLYYTDLSGTTIYNSDNGFGLAISLDWDGRNTGGEWIEEGQYQVLLVVSDGVTQLEFSEEFYVDTTAPEVTNLTFSPETISPNADGVDDTMLIELDLNESSLVTVYIFEFGGSSLVNELARTEEDGHVAIEWDGNTGNGTPLDPGEYEVKIWVRDLAANRFEPYPIRQSIFIE